MLQWLKNILTKGKRDKSYEQYLWVEYKIHPNTGRHRVHNDGFVSLGHIGYDGQYYKARQTGSRVFEV